MNRRTSHTRIADDVPFTPPHNGPWYESHSWVVLRPWMADGTPPCIVAITTSAEAADAAARLLGAPVIVRPPLLGTKP